MSRLGKQPVALPKGVSVSVSGRNVTVKGKGGELKYEVHPDMKVETEDDQVVIGRPSDSKRHKELHGLTRALVQNMVTGVDEGFKKELTIIGVGWNAKMQGKKLVLQIGFCHTVDFEIPSDLNVDLPDQQNLVITGIDKQRVGQFAAEIRAVRPPEPYKGKGIRYKDEYVARKEGKSQVK